MAAKVLKHVAVREALVGLIDSGKYAVGDLIPSERELMATYGVSRITVRTALDSLVQDGHLSRIQGKGTYVRGGVAPDLIALTSFSEEMRSRGKTVTRLVLTQEVKSASEPLADELGIAPGDPVLCLDRVFLVDAHPVNRTTSYLPLSLFPGLGDYDLSAKSLYGLIEGEYATPITHARRMLEAVLATEEDTTTLGVREGDPLIIFQGCTYGNIIGEDGTSSEQKIEQFTCRYLSSPYRFDISQVRISDSLTDGMTLTNQGA